MNYKTKTLQEFGEDVRPRPQLKVITSNKAAKGKSKDLSVNLSTGEHIEHIEIVNKAPVVKDLNKINAMILEYRENGRRLARSLLRRWNVRMASDETDSVVDIALCEAAHRFSEEYGASFMTFLYYHLRGNLVRAVTNAAQANNIFLVFADSVSAGEWKPTVEDVANWLAPEIMEQRHAELDSPEHLLIVKEEYEHCNNALNKLDELEREVIVRSYLNQEALVDIAKSLGYSRCHISRVKRRALENLQNIISSQSANATTKSSKSFNNGSLGVKSNVEKYTVKQKDNKPAFTLRIAKVDRTQASAQKRRGRRRRALSSTHEHNQLIKTA